MLFQSGLVNRQRAGGLIQTSLPRQRYGVCPDAVRNRCAAMGACAAPALQTSTNSFESERTRGLRGFHQSILRRNREGTDSTKRGQVKSCSLTERTPESHPTPSHPLNGDPIGNSTCSARKGEVKKQAQKQCSYGADGKVQKTPVSGGAPPASKKEDEKSRGGRRGGGRVKETIVENKADFAAFVRRRCDAGGEGLRQAGRRVVDREGHWRLDQREQPEHDEPHGHDRPAVE